MNTVLIKSKARVRDRGEVFTAAREVNAMLDLLPENVFSDPLATFLEPACGTGNFLVAILARKLAHDDGADCQYSAKCMSSLYGVDIADDNVLETRARLMTILAAHASQDLTPHQVGTLRGIVDTNIVVGNFLTAGVDGLGLHRWDWSKPFAVAWPIEADAGGVGVGL